jgi:hypothetical protein
MKTLSATATAILERMERNRGYDIHELRAFAPDLSVDAVHEIMRELWVQRHVERFGYTGWRRERSTSPAAEVPNRRGPLPRRGASPGQDAARQPGVKETSRQTGVKPEDLFDHSAFEGMFK